VSSSNYRARWRFGERNLNEREKFPARSASSRGNIFAFQCDHMVQAITSDGTTAWSADVSQARWVMPDFQGGLVELLPVGTQYPHGAIVRLDGITGLADYVYTPTDGTSYLKTSSTTGPYLSLHTDGTVFAVLYHFPNTLPDEVIGIDPTTGTQKFSVPLTRGVDDVSQAEYELIVAGDGYAYVTYAYRDGAFPNEHGHLMLLRVNSSGAYNDIHIFDWAGGAGDTITHDVPIITNADQGVLVAWNVAPDVGSQLPGIATITGTSVNVIGGPLVAGQTGPVQPVLQAEDGSFVGTATTNTGAEYMIAFDATGSVRWAVPNDQPQIALADGGVIGQSGTTYDQNGSATGQVANFPTYSWTLNAYQDGPVDQVLAKLISIAKSLWPFHRANPSGNNTAAPQPDYAPLKSCPGTSPPCPQEAIMSALNALRSLLSSPNQTLSDNVFHYLPGTSQTAFYNYVSLQPRFWDGTRSQVAQNKGLCPSGFFNQFICSFGSQSVSMYLQQTEAEAVSQTPSDSGKGMQVFFNPSTGICNVFSVANPGIRDQGVWNQATLFHEALHGYTGKMDTYFESLFPNLTVQLGESVQITDYLEMNAIPGGAQGAAACTN
jgi:hypothetical protein